MAFHFLDKVMMRKYNHNDQTKTGICKSNVVPIKEKPCVEIRKNTEIFFCSTSQTVGANTLYGD